MRLYNAIFPLYIMWFFPPLFFWVLFGNFVIDAGVVFFAASYFGVWSQLRVPLRYIVTVWICGMCADIIGAVVLFVYGLVPGISPYSLYNRTGLEAELFVQGVSGYPEMWWALTWCGHIIVLALVGYGIYVCNTRIAVKYGIERVVAQRIAVLVATITVPWMWLLPLQWFVS